MPVEHFTKEDFVQYLQETFESLGWSYAGLVNGEHCYLVRAKDPNDRCSVYVRSSVHVNNRSAEAGDDSIRIWLVDGDNNTWLGKLETYTTRVKGWENRLTDKIREMQSYRLRAGDCPHCNQPLKMFKVTKKNENHGRPFATCSEHPSQFVWLDVESLDQPYFDMEWTSRVEKPIEEEEVEEVQEVDVNELIKSTQELLEEALTDIGKTFEEVVEKSIAPLISNEPLSVERTVSLDVQQKQAVTANIYKPLRIIAGAGSGKTLVISHRYPFIVNSGVIPIKIVVVTFGKNASTELLTRVKKQISIPPMAENQICTIHALCFRLLKEFFPVYRSLSVASHIDIKKLVEKSLAINEPDADNRPGWEETYAWINTCKSHGVQMEETAQALIANGWDNFSATLVHSVRTDLDMGLALAGKLTFPDMLLMTELNLNNSSGFKEYCQRKFSHLIVDEAQDTASQPMRILTTMFDHTDFVTMVGDPDQLLYRFTGATPEANLYDGFEKRYGSDAQTVMLPINYRSTQQIVKYGLNVISHNYAPKGGPYNAKYLKALTTPDGTPLGTKALVMENETAMSEAWFVVKMVMEMINNGSMNPGDFFVSARTRAQLGYLEAAFSSLQEEEFIPYVNSAGNSFFDLSHIQDVLGYMRLVNNGNDKEAFKRVYNIASNKMKVPWKDSPEYGHYVHHRFLGNEFLIMSDQTINGVWNLLRNDNRSTKYAWLFGMRDMVNLVTDLKAILQTSGVAALVDAICDLSYKKYIAASSGQEDDLGEGSRMDDIRTLKDLAIPFDESGKGLSKYLQSIDRMIAMARDSANQNWDGHVVLSTIHKLKGLERKVVIGVGVSEGLDETYGILPHTFSMVDPPRNGKLPGSRKGLIEDERCLFYVLITRAKEFIVLSSLQTYRDKPLQMSRFIAEMAEGEI